MSDIDLTEAVEAAALAVHLNANHDGASEPPFFCGGPAAYQRDDAIVAVAAAAPLIEAQVRAQIAADIEARVPSTHPARPYCDGLECAARIARGES